jgi:hypothetical protein
MPIRFDRRLVFVPDCYVREVGRRDQVAGWIAMPGLAKSKPDLVIDATSFNGGTNTPGA